MLGRVVFLLRDYKRTDWRKRLEALTEDLEAHGVVCVFAEGTPQEVCSAAGQEETGYREKEYDADRESILYVADSAAVCKALSGEGCYVLPCRHERNQAEAFESGMYFYVIEQLEEMDYESLDMAYRRLAGLPWEILQTRRCMIRETTVEDADAFYQIYEEPDITLYMEGLFADRDEEIAYMEDYIKKVYYFYGYGMWTVVEKESGRVIGRAGVSWREGFDLPELGFMIGVPWQRQGYAYEVCGAILAYARKELEMTRVQALVLQGNTKSARLCEKLGFAKQREINLEGNDYMVFEMDL